MTKTIDYYFTPASPYTYLGDARLNDIAARHGAAVRIRPVSYGEIFPKTGGLPLPKRAPARQAYRLIELERWREFLNIPLNLHPKHFPVPDRTASLMIIAADHAEENAGALVSAILSAVWAEDRDISNAETLKTIAKEVGLDGAAVFEAAEADSAAETFDAYTQEALEIGVFGAPTYVYDDEMFWGADRLDFLDRALV